jgi:hypothetical protein
MGSDVFKTLAFYMLFGNSNNVTFRVHQKLAIWTGATGFVRIMQCFRHLCASALLTLLGLIRSIRPVLLTVMCNTNR